MSNIYISHTPADKDFAERLRSALTVKGHNVVRGLQEGEERLTEHESSIPAEAEIIVYILTPAFLVNTTCLREVLDGAWHDIPAVKLRHKPVAKEKVPGALSSLDSVPKEGLFNENYENSFEELLAHVESALSITDRDQQSGGKTVRPTKAKKSTQNTGKRKNLVQSLLVALLILAVIFDFIGFMSSTNGGRQNTSANQLAASSMDALSSDPALAVKLALGALQKAQTPAAVEALRQSLPQLQQKTLLYQQGTPDITDAAFDPNGKYVAEASTDGLVNIWSLASDSVIQTIREPDSAPISSVAYNSNGSAVLTASLSGYARVFSASTGKLLATLKQPAGAPLYDAQFSPNSAEIVTAAASGVVGIFSISTQKQVGQITSPNNAATFAATISPNGKALAIASVNGSASIYIANRKKPIVLKVGGEVTALAFTPDSQEIVTAEGNGTAKVWEIANGQLLATLGNVGNQSLTDVAVSPDGQDIAVVGNNGTLLLYNGVTGVLLSSLQGATGIINSVAFSPNGKELLTGEQTGTVRIWNVLQPAQQYSFQEPGGADILNATYSPNGRQLATASVDNSIRIWSTATGQQTSVAHFPSGASPTALAFSPNGKELAVAGSNGKGFLYLSQKRASVNFTNPSGAPFLSVAFSPNGKDLVFSTQDGYLRIYDAVNGTLLKAIKESGGATIYQASYSPDGQEIAAVSRNGSLTYYSGGTYRKIWSSADTGNPSLLSLSFNSAGTEIVTDASNGEVSVFSTANGRMIKTIPNEKNILINSASFEPYSDNVLTAAGNGEAFLYSDTANQLLTVFGTPASPAVSQAIFSPNGDQVATVNNLGIVSLWSTQLAQSVSTLEQIAKNSLPAFSPTEIKEYNTYLKY